MSSNLDADLQIIWSLLFHIVADVEKRISNHLFDYQLTPPQFYVLKTLYEHDAPCAIGEIARQHRLSQATMTGLVKRLENTDPPLVYRERSKDDRRSVLVYLTDAGKMRFMNVRRGLMKQVSDMLGVLDGDGRDLLINYASHYVSDVAKRFPIG